MINELLRLLNDIRNFPKWSICERVFLINFLLGLILFPILIFSYLVYSTAFLLEVVSAVGLIILTFVNLKEIQSGQQHSSIIWYQIGFITFLVALGTSLFGSVSSNMGVIAVLMMICYYMVAGIYYSSILGYLCAAVMVLVTLLDYQMEVLPYSWVYDFLNLDASGQQLREILRVFHPGKLFVELLFISCIPLTVQLLKAFDFQMKRKTEDLERAHQMMEKSRDLSDRLLLETQEEQQELQESITKLEGVIRQVSEGNLRMAIPDFGDRPLGRLSHLLKGMVNDLQKSRLLDEQVRFQEQETSQELRDNINDLLSVVEEVGRGNLEVIPPDFGNKALGRLSRGLAEMIVNQNISRIEESRHQVAMARTNALVENSPNSLMMLDQKGMVRYMNPATKNMFRSLQQYTKLPVRKILDNKITSLFPETEMLSILTNPERLPYRGEFQFGPEYLYVEATAVYDTQKNFLGAMLAWEIISEEKIRTERNMRLQTKVKELAQQLTQASRELLDMSMQMATASNKTTEEAQTVVEEAKEIQKNIHHIASALEQMSSTFRHNEGLVAQSSQMSSEAVKSSRQASDIIAALGKSSISIGMIIQLINRITQQTNILALNATIQATRAGEAGKGFGVVAREVKALAQQTSEATKEIASQIKAIQSDSKQAVVAIQNISEVIHQMNDISDRIHKAIEEQSSTTTDISNRMEEASKAATAITEHITEVANVAEDTTSGVTRGREAVVSVDNIAVNLKDLVANIR